MAFREAWHFFPESLQKLSLDYTNYHTFISSFNKRREIAQRGHNKQKRNDLRQVSLAIVTLKDFGIPLFSHVYKGNVNDQVEFREYIQLLKERLPDGAKEDLTIVFDGGSNTKDKISVPVATPYTLPQMPINTLFHAKSGYPIV